MSGNTVTKRIFGIVRANRNASVAEPADKLSDLQTKLSEKNSILLGKSSKLNSQIKKLRGEVSDWNSRAARAKSALATGKLPEAQTRTVELLVTQAERYAELYDAQLSTHAEVSERIKNQLGTINTTLLRIQHIIETRNIQASIAKLSNDMESMGGKALATTTNDVLSAEDFEEIRRIEYLAQGMLELQEDNFSLEFKKIS